MFMDFFSRPYLIKKFRGFHQWFHRAFPPWGITLNTLGANLIGEIPSAGEHPNWWGANLVVFCERQPIN